MPDDDEIEAPVPIWQALGRTDERALLTIAAFFALAGIWHWPPYHETMLPPEEDLSPPGFDRWRRMPLDEGRPFALSEFEETQTGSEESREPPLYYDHLRRLIAAALETGEPPYTARAVAYGLSAPDDLVRICAIGSALDLFRVRRSDIWGYLASFADPARDETAREIASILMYRVFGIAPSLFAPSSITSSTAGTPDLLLIHGTVLPLSQRNRPTWSVPGSGPLFAHLQTYRNVYGASDYYRWEGGYTDYAREVAAQNLRDWLSLRGLAGIGAVAHSHGCNVLMAAMASGARFGRSVFLSCPVRWTEYSVPPASYADIVSVRVHFDFVIRFDRANQRFPRGTINDVVLPIWYRRHSTTTLPKTWANNRLDQYL